MSGFIPHSRGSFMLDFVVVAMAAVLPLLWYSIRQARTHKNYSYHKKLQTVLGIVLGAAIIAFELDMRIWGWRHLAEPSPYYDSYVFPSLVIHLCFAIPTLILWTYTIYAALRHKIDTRMNTHRVTHRKLGQLSAVFMLGTTITGWIFYYLSFIA